MADLNRYRRQTVLTEVGDTGQRKLADTSVLVVGVGGLGLPAATYLAGAGIGSITLVDHDRIELHNLHRQVIYTEDNVGQPKVASAAAHLRRLNSAIQVHERCERLSTANVGELVAGHDLILDTADNFATTYLLSDNCLQRGKPLVSASILGHRGYIGIFCGRAPSYRALFPDTPAEAATCNQAGVLGTAVGMLGLMQAQEAIKWVLAPEQALVGKLLSVDLWHNRFSVMDFSAAPEPDAEQEIPLLTQADVRADDLVVDVRGEQEVAAQPIAGAFHLPLIEGRFDLERLPINSGRTLFVCATGARAGQAARLCQRAAPQRSPCVLLT